MRIGVSALGFVLVATAARVTAGELVLSGQGTIGPETRAVTLGLACDPTGPGLSATLTVPRFEALAPLFDFDAFEGPEGTRKPLTAIRVAAPGGVRSVIATASGAVAADPPTSFALSVAASRRSENPLRGIAPGLVEAGARITWTQTSPRKGDAALVARLPVDNPVALKAALGPCLAP